MQDAVSRAYPHTLTRVGDIAWRARYHTHSELALEIVLWLDGSRIAGYTWLRTKGGFDMFRAPEVEKEPELLAEMLAVVIESSRRRVDAGDDLRRIYTFFDPQDAAMAEAVVKMGFERHEGETAVLLLDYMDAAKGLALPIGYSLDFVRDGDVQGRVEAQRAAFAPSDLTAPMYERVRRTWPYRPELDRIVKDAGGEVVAFCTGWYDEVRHAGLLEPVGCRPEHQNRGLARAVVADAVQALHLAGAAVVQVGSSGPAAVRAYEAAGFRQWASEVTFERSLVPHAVERA